MRLLPVLIAALVLFSPVVALAQEQNYQVAKSDKNEVFVLPYTASNRDKDSPLVYTFDTPKQSNWIISVTNNQTYVQSNDSKTIIRIQEPAPSEKYIEITMFGSESRTYWVAVNTPDAKNARLYTSPAGQPGWSDENPISISHDSAQGLTVTDGKRIVVDRLDLAGFAVGSIVVYGNDGEKTTPNATAGNITFEILYGSFSQSPLFLVPALVMAGVGGLVIGLLIFKKRKPE
jgi:hypothetical protein